MEERRATINNIKTVFIKVHLKDHHTYDIIIIISTTLSPEGQQGPGGGPGPGGTNEP